MSDTAGLIRSVDLDARVRAAGGYRAIDWSAWDRDYRDMQRARRAGLQPAPIAAEAPKA